MEKSSTFTKPSVCFVHDWLVTMRGGEKVLEAMCELYPDAPIFTLIANRKNLSPLLQSRKIYTSFLQWIPGIEKIYRYFLLLFPLAIKSLNIKEYDLVISSSHCVAKAAAKRKDATHVCYCHTPMRYLWGFEEEYLGGFPKMLRSMVKLYFKFLKRWDVETSKNVDVFIANSKNTANKIKDIYAQESIVIHPPIDDYSEKNVSRKREGNYYLLVSAMVQYKRIDLALEAFNQMKLPLVVIGDGPLMEQLRNAAHFDGIRFEGWVSTEKLWEYYQNCKALIFPGEEDFGIVPLEAQMCGKPVIAYGKGGILETVIPYRESIRNDETCTGIFFSKPSVESLIESIRKSQKTVFNSDSIRSHAAGFAKQRFKKEVSMLLEDLVKKGETSVPF